MRIDWIVADLYPAERWMRLGPVAPAVWHEVGDRLPIAADDDGFAVRLDPGQQAGEVGLCLVSIHRFHAGTISPVSPPGQRHLWITRSDTCTRVRLEVVDSRSSREVVGLLVKMELKDVMVRFTNGREE